ncbi:MAG: cation-translocating P-type ATPase, partial [Bacillota bacterium]
MTKQIEWYKKTKEEVLNQLNTNINGLSKQEVEKRLEKYGLNVLPKPKERHPIIKFLSHYNNVLIYVLLGAAVITAYLGHWVDTSIILVVVFINGLISYIQEGKAEQAIEAVKNMLSLNANVKREGQISEYDAKQIVPGDIVYLKSGDKIPADLRLIKVNDFNVNEASLTGESEPVNKNTEQLSDDLSLGDRKNMAYTGTLVSSGEAVGVVTATGENTELGKINKMISEVKKIKTPLMQQVDQFGKYLTVFILSIGLITLLIGQIFRGLPLDELFLSIVGIAVAAIPEGLPAIITITLAIGVKKMADRNAIIRKLPAVETLGSVTIICSDKTGTLTEGEMTVKEIITRDNEYTVTGNGYTPEGDIKDIDGNNINLSEGHSLDLLIKNAGLCNDARLLEKEGKWVIEGSPTEGALQTLSAKSDHNLEKLKNNYQRIDGIPFSSLYKYMATLNNYNDKNIIFLKGAPESVLDKCSKELYNDQHQDINLNYWEEMQNKLAEQGYRVLSFAYKIVDKNKNRLTHDDLDDNLIFLGMAGIVDPPRQEAIEAIEECHRASINVKMITGDHARTATAIAEKLGINTKCNTITGAELDELNDQELEKIILKTDVFARVSPKHKLRLVNAMQNLNHITAMTGDGVNDAPALKKSDIGIAMGIKGTEAAKEASEMVLADDNFRSIANAVEEGRTVYDNLKKALLFMLPTNGGEALVIMAAVLFGFSLPITPVQILWVNMITAVTLALTLAFEPMEEDVMERPPRDSNESLTPLSLLIRIGYVSILLTLTTLSIYYWAVTNNLSIELSRSLAVNMLVFGEVFYLFNSRYMTRSSFTMESLKATKWVWRAVIAVIIFQIIFVYLPFMQNLFGVEALNIRQWLIVIIINFFLFVFVELEKY